MNNRMRQTIGIVIGTPVGITLGVSVFYLIFVLEGTARLLCILLLLALLIGVVAFFSVRSTKGRKLIDGLLDILYKEVDPARFVAESEKALAKTKNRALRATLSLNLAVGHEAMGNFGEAVRVMEEMDITAADKISKAMYYSNAAAFYAENGMLNRAESAYTAGQPFFEKAGEAVSLAHVRMSRALLYYADGKYEEALEVLENARSRGFEERHSLAKLQLFEARSLVKLGKIKEAKAVYSKIVQKNTYPYILSAAKAEMAAINS